MSAPSAITATKPAAVIPPQPKVILLYIFQFLDGDGDLKAFWSFTLKNVDRNFELVQNAEAPKSFQITVTVQKLKNVQQNHLRLGRDYRCRLCSRDGTRCTHLRRIESLRVL
jgi:hypothetical protein